MKTFLRINTYETQAILYWILGVLVLQGPNWHWVGWISVIWGFITFFALIVIGTRNKEDLKSMYGKEIK